MVNWFSAWMFTTTIENLQGNVTHLFRWRTLNSGYIKVHNHNWWLAKLLIIVCLQGFLLSVPQGCKLCETHLFCWHRLNSGFINFRVGKFLLLNTAVQVICAWFATIFIFCSVSHSKNRIYPKKSIISHIPTTVYSECIMWFHWGRFCFALHSVGIWLAGQEKVYCTAPSGQAATSNKYLGTDWERN